MTYSDIELLPFVAVITVIASSAARKLPKFRSMILYIFTIIMAILCYCYNAGEYFLLFGGSIIMNVIAGRTICTVKSTKVKKAVFIAAVSADALLIAGAKFLSFRNGSFIMPLGLSFYTFREISYLADIYTGKCKPLDDPIGDIAYIAMFTQIQSGPITRYSSFTVSDINSGGVSGAEWVNNLTDGIQRIMLGFSKKILIADTLASIVKTEFSIGTDDISLPAAWLGAVCFALQLYYDFSGYSDMAIGFTNLLGYKCPENFNYPYASGSITEFWRRWHITLGEWFKHYVYIPLGGSRSSKSRTLLNLLIVWLLTGLWHGSRLTFVVWGMIHFTFAAIEHFTGIHKTKNLPTRIIWRIVTITAVIIAWVMFRAGSVSYGLGYIRAMFVPNGMDIPRYPLLPYWKLIAASALFSLPVAAKLREKVSGKKAEAVYDFVSAAFIVLLFVIAISVFYNRTNNTFAYANF